MDIDTEYDKHLIWFIIILALCVIGVYYMFAGAGWPH